MIITRTPLRISLGGGGTDVPSYYRKAGSGFLIAAAISKYVYIAVNQNFDEAILLKYSQVERVYRPEDIAHPLLRECLLDAQVRSTIEISSMADIPAGTGLGSSGAFTVGVLKALHAFKHEIVPNEQIAERACEIEIERLQQSIGKQDQYIAAIGGLTAFEFHADERVEVIPITLAEPVRHRIEDNLLLFFTGYSRSASSILKDQKVRSEKNDQAMLDNLHFTKYHGYQSLAALETGNLGEFARLMDVHWQRKKARYSGMSNDRINEWYDYAMAHGALGGKIIGAGGGGFLMFYAGDKAKLRHAMREKGLQEVRFRFDFEGTKVVTQN